MQLQGAAAIVTGSASGVGAATALALAERGCNIVINYSKSFAEAEEAEAACRATGVETLLCRADISEDDDCRAMAQQCLDKWGRIDVLVNNAGTTKFTVSSDLDSLTKEDFLRIYGVNVVGTYQMIRAVAPAMKAGGEGAIVNVSSIAGISGGGSSIAYATSKAGINNMTLALANILAPEIRINTVCPGFIDTRWLRNGLGAEQFEAVRARIKDTAPLHIACMPEDIAAAILSFIEGSRVLTGQILVVDAGQSLPGGSRGFVSDK